MIALDPFAGSWLSVWMQENGIDLWGAADLRGFSTPRGEDGRGFPYALSWAVAMDPQIMMGIQQGPNQAYAGEYARVNRRINELSQRLVGELRFRGHRSQPLAASDRTDKVHIRGDFPHKTAATRAGLGWVGRNCQLVTNPYGPWVRLGTVFTDMDLVCGPPVERSFCGGCVRCVEACPAGALTGSAWVPGVPRKRILDAAACDRWKKEHYYAYHQGHNCGICAAVCPYGQKTLAGRGAQVLLETERLTLRRFTSDDADNLYDLDSDPEVMRYLSGGAGTPRDAIETEILPLFLRYDEGFPGFGFWAAIERTTGEFLGWFSFRSRDEKDPREVTLGFRLRKAVWGRGYATEGARALIQLGFAELGVERVVATTYEENLASRRVMEKAGMTLTRRFRMTTADFEDVDTYQHGFGEPWDGDDVEYAVQKTDWLEAEMGACDTGERQCLG